MYHGFVLYASPLPHAAAWIKEAEALKVQLPLSQPGRVMEK